MFENSVRVTNASSFCCAAISQTTWKKIGPLDETVFLTQYNDAEYALRARRMGFRRLHVGTEVCRHEPRTSEWRTQNLTRQRLKTLRERYPELRTFGPVDFDHLELDYPPKFKDTLTNGLLATVAGLSRIRLRLDPAVRKVRTAVRN